MLTALLIGFFTGVFISMPVGPVNVLLVSAALRQGFRYGFMVGLGAALMDLIYMVVALFGLSLLTFGPDVQNLIKGIGIVFLFALGLRELTYTKERFERSSSKNTRPRRRDFFATSVFLYLTNPVLYLVFAGLATVFQSQQLFPSSPMNNLVAALALAGGSLVWFFLLSTLVQRYRDRIKDHALLYIIRGSGALLIGFGLYLVADLFFPG